jgi:hypothetical protein
VRAFHRERSPRAGCDVHTSTPNLASTKKVCAQKALEPEFSLRLTGIGPLKPCPSLHCQRKPSGCCGDVSNWLFRSQGLLLSGCEEVLHQPATILRGSLSAQCNIVAPCRPLEISFSLSRKDIWMVHGKHFSFSGEAAASSFRILELAGGLHCSLLYNKS